MKSQDLNKKEDCTKEIDERWEGSPVFGRGRAGRGQCPEIKDSLSNPCLIEKPWNLGFSANAQLWTGVGSAYIL